MSTASDLLSETKTSPGGARVEVWTLNRPEKLNALNANLLKRIDEEGRLLSQKLQDNPAHIRALILRGAGDRAFVAGADISELKNLNREEGESFSRLGQAAFGRIEELNIPTIAALQGFTLGGGLELAMACDVLVATPETQLGQPESHLGLIPGFGATVRFVDRLGFSKALELLYSGKRISAPEAQALGLIERIAPAGVSIFDFAMSVADELTLKSSPQALATIKQLVRAQSRTRFCDALDREAKAFGKCFDSADKKEGVEAFLTKRAPRFLP